MVKQYQRKRTKEELISGFKQAIAKKKEWLEAHHIHLLIREREDTIGMAIKRVSVRTLGQV